VTVTLAEPSLAGVTVTPVLMSAVQPSAVAGLTTGPTRDVDRHRHADQSLCRGSFKTRIQRPAGIGSALPKRLPEE
jgi:hypothetical protein